MGDLLKATAYESLAHNVQIRTVTPAPAVGGEIVITVPSPEAWRIIGVRARFTASAAVANRVATLAIDDQTNIGGQVGIGVAMPATQVADVCWLADLGTVSVNITGSVLSGSIPPWVLPTGYRLRTITTNIDVGDQWSNVSVMIERIDEPPFRVPLLGTALDDEVEHELQLRSQGG